jgi:sphingosine kinase
LLGGDGMIHDTINGIYQREDHADLLKRITLGIIGCGTCNGYATSIANTSDEFHSILSSAFLIVKGQSMMVDCALYQSRSRQYISHLTFTWAMVADIDIESECLRWMGEPRVDIWGVWCILRLRKYRGRLSYLSRRDVKMPIVMPALGEPLADDWQVIEDDIILLWVSLVPNSSMNVINSPDSRLDDGVFRIMLVRGSRISRIQMSRILLSLESGKHVYLDGVEFIECVAFRLEPLVAGSFNDLDGEVIESGPVQACVLPQFAQVHARNKYGASSEEM